MVVMGGGETLPAQDTLHSPLTIPLKFSGNFGEIRTGHFHTGLDIRTEGREGLPILAAQDGTVSRIKVSDGGYGLALYLDGGGLTTVYAHLSAFHPEIERWLMARQYREEQWAFDGTPDVTFRFSAGDTIGWSGNSGGSFGPHLHFEVRDARNQHPINPLLWRLEGAGVTRDQVPPQFRGIWVVPEPGGRVEGDPVRFRWTAAYGEGVRVAGPFTVGVEGFDRMDGEGFTHGPYGLDVWLNDSLVHRHRMDTLDFSTNRDVSAHIDLPAWQDRKGRVHRVHRLPGNRLDIYQRAGGPAPWSVSPGDSLRLEVSLSDVAGNETRAAMWIHGEAIPDTVPAGLRPAPVDHRRGGRLEVGEVSVDIPAFALYSDAVVSISREGSRFHIESEARITRSSYTLGLPVDSAWGGSGETLVVCALDTDGGVDGTWVADERHGRVEVRLDRFGTFEVRRDTLGPQIGMPSIVDGVIRVPVEDGLTGLSRWEGRCGDQWLRWGHDKGILSHRLSDGRLEGRGSEDILLWAIDRCGNIGRRIFTLDSLEGN